MSGDNEQTDSAGKYTFGGGGGGSKKIWPTILKGIELVSQNKANKRVMKFYFHHQWPIPMTFDLRPRGINSC